jgi:hypothetical protein
LQPFKSSDRTCTPHNSDQAYWLMRLQLIALVKQLISVPFTFKIASDFTLL